MALSAPAWAQGSGPVPGGVGAEPVQEVDTQSQGLLPKELPPYDKLLGDMGGMRQKMFRMGVNLQLDYVAEFGYVVSGQRTGFDYAGQLGFSADVDWERAAGIPGFNTHVVIINRHGRSLAEYTGDGVSQPLEVYGAGFDMVAHLVYAYAEEKLADDRVNIAVGRLPVGTDFGSSPLACIAVALTSACGQPRALASSTGFTNWPQSSWGGRIRGRPTPETYIQVGAYETVPFPGGGRSGFNWFPGTATGVTIPVELGWNPSWGANQLQGHYTVGYYHDTSQYRDFFTGERRDGRDGYWVMADQMVWRHGPGPDQGLILMGHYAHVSKDITFLADTAFGAIIDKGIIPGRPNDIISGSFSWFHISDRLQQLQAFNGQPVQRNEYVMEVNYTASVFPGVTVEPAVQYWMNPNADRRVKNAVVLAGRVHVDF